MSISTHDFARAREVGGKYVYHWREKTLQFGVTELSRWDCKDRPVTHSGGPCLITYPLSIVESSQFSIVMPPCVTSLKVLNPGSDSQARHCFGILPDIIWLHFPQGVPEGHVKWDLIWSQRSQAMKWKHLRSMCPNGPRALPLLPVCR